jgi:hypothetical protein
VADDVGATLRGSVTASDGHGSSPARSTPASEPVARDAPRSLPSCRRSSGRQRSVPRSARRTGHGRTSPAPSTSAGCDATSATAWRYRRLSAIRGIRHALTGGVSADDARRTSARPSAGDPSRASRSEGAGSACASSRVGRLHEEEERMSALLIGSPVSRPTSRT